MHNQDEENLVDPHPAKGTVSLEARGVVTFEPTITLADAGTNHELFSRPAASRNPELMGPILRRKKVVSMPLGAGGKVYQ